MKMIKTALLGGVAIAMSAAAAHADELDALKAQIETLNARVAAMETAPSVPAGYQLVTVSKGAQPQVPGLGLTAREIGAYGDKATTISVMPTADAPAGTTITWSGYARAGLVYNSQTNDRSLRAYDAAGVELKGLRDIGTAATVSFPVENDDNTDDIDVKARGQLRVVASTDTAVGEVGVDIRLRANFNGNGAADVYSDVAWGYWSMTPELTLGGGYAGSLGNIGYGYDGACTCYYTDNSDVAFNPGDTTQMRLSYASGPVSFAIALEDASLRAPGNDYNSNDTRNPDRLGAAGEIKYSGDMFSGEVSGVWRDVSENDYGADNLWQVGAGVGFALGDMAKLSLAAAMGEGPFVTETDGNITSGLPYNQSWWGVSALASFNLTDDIHAELGAGYKKREGDEFEVSTDSGSTTTKWESDGADYSTYSFLGGLYYNPVDQLTIGVEAEYYTTDTSFSLDRVGTVPTGATGGVRSLEADSNPNTFSVDLVSVWRF